MKSKLLVSVIILFTIITMSVRVNAQSFSSNKKTVTVGESFSVTISGVNGQVKISSNDKVNLSTSGIIFIHGSQTITGTAKNIGTGTINIKYLNATTSGADPIELDGKQNSVSVTIKEKEVAKAPAPTTPSQTQASTNNKTTKKKETSKKETTKKETEKAVTKEITPTQEKEEATPEWGISEVKLVGIKSNGESIDIELDKKFDIKTYEYFCNVSSDIQKIEIKKEAYEYNNYVSISGLEEDLKDGENIITLKLSKEGQEELTYTIKVNKEAAPTEQISTDINENEQKKDGIRVSMPLWGFILLEIIVVSLTAGITIFIMKKKHNSI